MNARILLVTVVALPHLIGCAPADVAVAYERRNDAGVADDDGSATPEAGTRTCRDNQDCLSGAAYCAKSSCGALQGLCMQRPSTCDSNEQEVCGCDGIEYWNDCLRQRDGVASSTNGSCLTTYQPCTTASDCPAVPDVKCGILSYVGGGGGGGGGGPGGACSPVGICWVLPDTCPADAGGPYFARCDFTPGCADLCSALASQVPQLRVPPMQCNPLPH